MLEKPNLQKIVNKLLENRTQKELQKMTGVPQSTISSLKNGVGKKRLTFDNAFALIHAFEQDKQNALTQEPQQPKTPNA